MAKKKLEKLNKSEAIRAGLKALGSGASGPDVVAWVAKNHPHVKFTDQSSAEVSGQRSKVREELGESPKEGRKTAKRRVPPNASGGSGIEAAVEFIKACGSLENAQNALDKVKEIRALR